MTRKTLITTLAVGWAILAILFLAWLTVTADYTPQRDPTIRAVTIPDQTTSTQITEPDGRSTVCTYATGCHYR